MQGKLKATFPYLVRKIYNFPHVTVGAWHLMNRLLNTVWSSSLDIADTAQVLMSVHDSHTASTTITHTVTKNHLSHTVQFNLLCVPDVWRKV